jgi:hypothetical protein
VAGLADPLLAFAADSLTDLEKVRIANENRLRQLTRDTEDADGELRGFGLDESHPDVARIAALVELLCGAEHQAELNLGRRMRAHPLYPWVQASKGVGVKQAARLLAAIGDPYMRPEITTSDGTVEPARPRRVSELWAFTGYHVIQVPAGGQDDDGPHPGGAAGGEDTRTSHTGPATPAVDAGAGPDSHPSHRRADTHTGNAGVAPRRQRGVRANWSSTAKMRAFLVAESCIKQLDGGYRRVYDAARVKYADAVHEVACVRCGPRGNPAPPGSPLSDGHKHGRGLRAVAKQVLKDLWREARAVHDPTGSHVLPDPQDCRAAGGPQSATSSQAELATQSGLAAGGATPVTGGQAPPGTQGNHAAGDPPPAASSQSATGTQGGAAAGSLPSAASSQPRTGTHRAAAAGGTPSAASGQIFTAPLGAGAAGGAPSAAGGQPICGTPCRAAAGGGPSTPTTSQGAA